MSIILSIRSWMESNAIEQFNQTLKWDYIINGSGMPDMHYGKYGPNGSVFLSKKVYPVLAGNDIGCGYRFEKLNTTIKIDKMAKRLRNLEDIPLSFEDESSVSSYQHSLGTIGGGNHFLEIQVVDEILDEKLFKSLDLDSKSYYALVHSGSRGLGTDILNSVIDKHMMKPLDGEDNVAYMKQHLVAMDYAVSNRKSLINRLKSSIGCEGQTIFDVPHNYIEKTEKGYLHRKGASPTDRGVVMIPGSRGDYSYLVMPINNDKSLNTIAHGAGRKIARGEAIRKVNKTINSKIKNIILCDNKQLNIEEDASCYKRIEHIIQDLVEHDLITIIAKMRPVITYKQVDDQEDKISDKEITIKRKKERKSKYKGEY